MRPCAHRKAHQAETGLTSYLERFNNTLRQRGSRLVRKAVRPRNIGVRRKQRAMPACNARQDTLSFSKSLENHISAIWYFVHYYLFSTTLNLTSTLFGKNQRLISKVECFGYFLNI